VTGYFDVITAALVRDLEVVRKATGDGVVMIVLLPLEESLLSGRARAELAAALSVVDYVVTETEGSMEEFVARLAADEVISRQVADEQQTRLLIEHVLVRHGH